MADASWYCSFNRIAFLKVILSRILFEEVHGLYQISTGLLWNISPLFLCKSLQFLEIGRPPSPDPDLHLSPQILIWVQMSSGEESNISKYYLDEKAFYICCKLFLQHSAVIKDGWSWAKVKGGEEDYIKKTAIIPGRLSSLLNQKADDGISALTGADELDDDAVGAYKECESQSQVLMHYEYHVLYSFGHQVPTLYFRASTLDGQPLSLDEVWKNIHPNYRQRLLQGPWDTLTQQEHPLLGQPFFMLHPCHTEEFMRPILKMENTKKRKVNYIATWLSVVGPVVGLDVPLSYHTALTAPD